MKIKASQFVKRQTPQSEFSHYRGSWEEVERLVENHFDQAKPGYRDGVVLVNVPPAGFFSSLVRMTADLEFETVFAPRREGEPPIKKPSLMAKNRPQPMSPLCYIRKRYWSRMNSTQPISPEPIGKSCQ